MRVPIHRFLDPTFVPDIQWIGNCSRYDFLADCFGIIDGDQLTVLAERFSYRGSSHVKSGNERRIRTGRGHITSITLNGLGEVIGEAPAIDNGLHMSYPFPIYDRGEWHIVAEELSGDKVALYRRDGCGEWKIVTQILPHAVIDPTIVRHNSCWWMFGTTADGPCSELHIWYSDSLSGKWRPHANNPVRVDGRNARSGGTPFYFDGSLYRPTQNSTNTYGGSVVINRIQLLTGDAFQEYAVRELHPSSTFPFNQGTHTLSAFGEWTLIDAKRHIFLPGVALRNVARRLMR